jgi:hypothetical protein
MNKQEKFAKKLLEFNLGGKVCKNYSVCTEPANSPLWAFCALCHQRLRVSRMINSPKEDTSGTDS